MSDRSSRPSSVRPNQRSVAPVRCGDQLPRHDVGVVLHLGDDDLVTRAEAPPEWPRSAQARTFAARLSASVEFLVNTTSARSAASMNAATLSRALLVQRRGLLGRACGWPRCTLALCRRVVVVEGVEHLTRLLRGRRVVQVDQRLAVRGRAAPAPGSPCGPSRRPARGPSPGSCASACLGQELLVALGLEGVGQLAGRPPRRSGRRRRRARSRAGCSAGSGCSA